ncbi:MAG: hypothetical protein HYW05_00130 [Candidatus Diapherotrites archaeon]|nr:hypothetical protein [Candidatus Diapherotrites archaeon]
MEKAPDRKEKEKLMIEGYKKMAKLDEKIEKEMKHVSKEADAIPDGC